MIDELFANAVNHRAERLLAACVAIARAALGLALAVNRSTLELVP
jgi:hypothetical protein